MTPMAHDARTRLAPWPATVSGKVVPVEFFFAEFTVRPRRHSRERISLRAVTPSCIRAVLTFGELVDNTDVAAHADQKDSPPALRDAVIPSVQHLPYNAVPRKPIAIELILKESTVFAIGHSVHVLDHKCARTHYS